MRTCKECGLEATTSKELEDFASDVGSKYGKRNRCKPCHYLLSRESILKNPKRHKNNQTKHQVRKRYNVSLEEYRTAMTSSEHCEICESVDNLCYDHDHDTMKFRGILCRLCNASLGGLGDTLEDMNKVIKYLTKDIK